MRKILLACSSVLILSGAAIAQDTGGSYFGRDRNVSVSERPKPEYASLGIRAGSFTVRPELRISTEYNDNIYATGQNEVDGTILGLVPSVDIQSNWSQHSLRFQSELNRRTYREQSSENTVDFTVSSDARIDVRRGTFVNFGADYSDTHEGRAGANSLNGAAEPVTYARTGAYVRTVRESGRFRVSSSARIQNFEYDPVRLNNGTSRSLDDRNRDEMTLELRGDYAVSPDTSVFIRGGYVRHEYEDNSSTRRDQSGWALDVGTEFDISDLVRGEFGIGYFERVYDSSSFSDVSELSVNALVDWFPTPLQTITLELERAERASGISGSPSYTLSAADLRAEYEVLRNLILQAGTGIRTRQFQALDREDDVFSVFAGGTYFVNRNIGVNLRIQHSQQDSSGLNARPDFDANTITLGIVLKK